MPHDKRVQGFTLLELMVTVAIMAIMAAIAFPSMRDFVSNSRLVNRSEQIANAFRFARTEAVRMNTPVLLCGVLIRKDGRNTGVCDEQKSAMVFWFLRMKIETVNMMPQKILH